MSILFCVRYCARHIFKLSAGPYIQKDVIRNYPGEKIIKNDKTNPTFDNLIGDNGLSMPKRPEIVMNSKCCTTNLIAKLKASNWPVIW